MCFIASILRCTVIMRCTYGGMCSICHAGWLIGGGEFDVFYFVELAIGSYWIVLCMFGVIGAGNTYGRSRLLLVIIMFTGRILRVY